MHRVITSFQRRQTIFCGDAFGDQGSERHARERFFHGAAHRFLIEIAFQRVYGHDAFQPIIFIERLERGIDDRHRAEFSLHSAVKKIFARFQFRCHVRLIEPHRRECEAVLRTKRFHVTFSAVHGRSKPHHFAGDQHRFVMRRVFQRRAFRKIEIGAGIMTDEFFRRGDAHFREIFFSFFADTAKQRNFHTVSFFLRLP